MAKPRDKVNVERSVRIIYQRIYAKLRDRQITGIEELNKMIWVELEELNTEKSIRSHLERNYEEYEQTHMLPLDYNSIDGNQKKQNITKWLKLESWNLEKKMVYERTGIRK